MGIVLSLFDMDGTLLDNMGLHADLAADCMAQYLGMDREEARHRYIETIGVPFPEQLEQIAPGDGYAQARVECTQAYVKRKIAEVYGKTAAFPDVVPGLWRLYESDGVGLFVSTSTEKKIADGTIGRLGFLRAFGDSFGKEQGTKPHHIEKVKERLSPDKVFFVGDSPEDMKLSGYGVTTIGRAGNTENGMHTADNLRSAGATEVIESFEELPRLILR